MGGKKRNAKKTEAVANSKKSESNETEQETSKDLLNNVTPANKRVSRRSGVSINNIGETNKNDAEEKIQKKKDTEECKEEEKVSTEDSPKASLYNNVVPTSKKATKRTTTTNSNVGEASSPKILRGVRKGPPKEEAVSTTDNGKAKLPVKEKLQGREYEVEAIMGKRKTKGAEEFLVKWKGYSEKENSWEPKRNLNCQRLLDEFLKSKN